MVKKTWIFPLDGVKHTVVQDASVLTVDGSDNKLVLKDDHVNFTIGGHQCAVVMGNYKTLWVAHRLIVDGVDVETGDLYQEHNKALWMCIGFVFGFAFGLFILVPFLIAICVCFRIHRDDVVELEEIAKPGVRAVVKANVAAISVTTPLVQQTNETV